MKFLKIIYKKIIPENSSFQFFLWKYRHIIDKKYGSESIDLKDLNHPHRFKIIDILKKDSFTNVLEIGCGKGHNLFLLSENFPQLSFTGIDINKRSIEITKKYASEKKFSNISFSTKNFQNLKQIPDKQFDVVISDAVLIYVDSKIIDSITKEIIRIAKKRIILIEYFDEQTDALGYAFNRCWIRNYQLLFKEFSKEILIEKIEAGIWTENWEKFGRYIEIILK